MYRYSLQVTPLDRKRMYSRAYHAAESVARRQGFLGDAVKEPTVSSVRAIVPKFEPVDQYMNEECVVSFTITCCGEVEGP